jgi:Gram-negative bacterial TonB protein C-terminal
MPQTATARDVSTVKQYTWSFPGSLTVKLNLDMVSRLQARLGEIQEGLLIGKGTGEGTEVVDFREISREEAAKFRAGIRPSTLETAASALGYFRVKRDGDLRLTPEDLELAKSAFPHPHEVILLIQHGERAPANATFFFWDGGRMFGDFAFLEFPFDASLLAAMEPVRQPGSDAVRDNAKPSGSVEPTRVDVRPQNGRKHSSRSRLARVALLVVVLAAGLGMVQFALSRRTGVPRLESVSPPAGAAQTASLGIRVKSQRGDLVVMWDREAPAIANGTVGALVIQDGETRVIPLNSELLHSGRLIYSPTTDQIRLGLTVEGPGRPSTTEMVLVAIPAAGPPQVRAANKAPAAPVERLDRPEQHAAARRADEAVSAKAEVPMRRPDFKWPPAMQAKPMPMPPAPNPVDLPSVAARAPAGYADSPLQKVLGNEAVPPAPIEEKPPSIAQSPAAYRPPEIVSRTVPTIPSTFRGRTFQTETVKLTISLDQNGKIANVAPDAPRRLSFLVSAAEAAVQKWTFKPAKLGDRNVPSEIVVNFKFEPLR